MVASSIRPSFIGAAWLPVFVALSCTPSEQSEAPASGAAKANTAWSNAVVLYPRTFRSAEVVRPVVENFEAAVRRSRLDPRPVADQRFDEDERPISPSETPTLHDAASRSGWIDTQAGVLKQRLSLTEAPPLIARFLMTPSPASEIEFDTNPDSNLNRPDSAIAAGPNALVTAVNFAMRVQDLDGSNPESTGIGTSFFPDDPTNSIGDPRLSYDPASGRFIASWLGFDYPDPDKNEPPEAGDSFADVAISRTSDPRGDWIKYTFHVLRGTEQMDFDSLGYDDQAIYVTARMRDFANNTQFSGNRMLILDKAAALAGEPLSPVIVDDLQLPGGGLAEIVKPVEFAEPVTPSSPGYFLCTEGNSNLAFYAINDPLGTPSFSAVSVGIPTWASAGLAPQSGGPDLYQGAGFPLHKTMIRDGVIWSCQSPSGTGVANDPPGVTVYKIDAASATLLESHVLADPSLSYYLPAVVPDISGNAVVTFAGSDASHFASIYHARYVAALGDFEAPRLTEAGSSSFNADGKSTEVWGDYLEATPDVATGYRAVWVHGELPISVTAWKMRAALIPSTPRPIIELNTDTLDYGTHCPFETVNRTLTASNAGGADLLVNDITRVAGSSEFAFGAGPGFPTTISPGDDADYSIEWSSAFPGGTKTATFRVFSNDPVNPTVDVGATGLVDGPPPVLSPTPPVTFETCSDGLTSITLTPPTATDPCNLPVTITGVVTSSSPEIPVNGPISLPPGVHTVEWTADDMLNTATAIQIVTVQPGLMVTSQFQLRSSANVQTVAGAPAGVGNAGSLLTRIENNAPLADILSVAPVVLTAHATVQGSIRSSGSITIGPAAEVTGPVVPFTAVSLPPVPDLSSVVFPPPSGGNQTFTSTHGGTVPLAPGSYGTVTLKPNARVALAAGDYFIQSLFFDAPSSALVIPTLGTVRIFVATELAYRGQVVTAGGELAQILLGYDGTLPISLDSPFYGTLIAPHALVSFSTSAHEFRGRFFGQDFDVRANVRMICDTDVTAK